MGSILRRRRKRNSPFHARFFLYSKGDTDFGDSNDGMDSDTSTSSSNSKQVVVGICAMAKKTQSKPMKEILTRLGEFEFIKLVTFEENVILREPVQNWPTCDCLVSFHSKGFPLEKAIEYAQLRNPFVLNNLHMQYDIQDRRRVYAILEKEGIEIPRYAVLDRDSPDPKRKYYGSLLATMIHLRSSHPQIMNLSSPRTMSRSMASPSTSRSWRSPSRRRITTSTSTIRRRRAVEASGCSGRLAAAAASTRRSRGCARRAPSSTRTLCPPMVCNLPLTMLSCSMQL